MAKIDFSCSALLIIDVQNDFCPGGPLEVRNGLKIIEPLNSIAAIFTERSGMVIATQDWHPVNHASFAASHKDKKPYDTIDIGEVHNQVLWPIHCVQGSTGADFHKDLNSKSINLIIRKGFRRGLDAYSAFFENDRKTPTGLDGLLKSLSINTVVIGGLATDYCVLYSALDATTLGYKAVVVENAVYGIDFPAGSVETSLSLMDKSGVIFVSSGDIQ